MQFALILTFFLLLRENIRLLGWKHIVSFIIHHESSCWENSMSSSNQIDSRAPWILLFTIGIQIKKNLLNKILIWERFNKNPHKLVVDLNIENERKILDLLYSLPRWAIFILNTVLVYSSMILVIFWYH